MMEEEGLSLTKSAGMEPANKESRWGGLRTMIVGSLGLGVGLTALAGISSTISLPDQPEAGMSKLAADPNQIRLPPNYQMYTTDMFEHPKVIEAFQNTNAQAYLSTNGYNVKDPQDHAYGQQFIREHCFGPTGNIDVYINEEMLKNDMVDYYGYTVFNVDCRDDQATPLLAFILVLDIYGQIVNVHNPPIRAESVSMYDPDTVLFSCVGKDGAWLWNWRTDQTRKLAFAPDQHSLVWDPSRSLFFGMERADNNKFDASICSAWDMDGNQVWRFEMPEGSSHINYITIGGDYAYLSLRSVSGIAKLDLNTNEQVLTIGSEESDVPIIDFYGEIYQNRAGWASTADPTAISKGRHFKFEGAWYRQHKGQHLSDKYFSLFDNHITKDKGVFQDDRDSRMVVVELDMDQKIAKEVWAFDTGDQSKIYGGADVVPSGNVLGNSWPTYVDPTDWDHQYHVNLWEVAPDGQIAWRVSFRGFNPFNPSDYSSTYIHTSVPEEEAPVGWVSYNLERIYDAPVFSQPCLMTYQGYQYIQFYAFNSIRTQADMPGVAYLSNAATKDIIGTQEFFFQKSYIPRVVFMNVPDNVPSAVDIVVVNSWSQTRVSHVGAVSSLPQCSSLPNNRLFFE
uniref:Uncharacterized protein n=1 Tax=Fibrocapsa japonica TaxID=94617 RepID=A0A7S2Y0Y9_9STRA|mmetsp:Transcript_6579/g.9944  ORF Transcript_6579/g.9944 Transcript_6579/m.9944 type:complete len:621 (+) Transcript_6579:24-1886(+)